MEECRQIMEMERSDPPTEALYALLAVVTADYVLSEQLSLFIGDPNGRPAGEASCGEAMIQTVDWCMDTLQRCGRSPWEGETLAQVVTGEVLWHARTVIAAASPHDAEEFFLWEVSAAEAGAAPVYVLRFSAGFNFVPLRDRFVKRGFTRSDYHGATIFSHEQLDPTADWMMGTDLAIRNTAILPDAGMLVLSSSAQAVRSVLDAARHATPSQAAAPAIHAAMAVLGTVAAAMVFPHACTYWSARTLMHLTAHDALIVRRLHPYSALGLGYRYEQKRPVGLLVLHFASATVAGSDLAPRRARASRGTSPLISQPYSTLFTLLGATATGPDLVLRMYPHPARRGPRSSSRWRSNTI
jgi:hypothetical protein